LILLLFIFFKINLDLDVNLSHPVKLAFCECLKQNRFETNAENKTQYKKLIRNKWQLLYTLIKNPGLIKQRKKYLDSLKSKSVGKRFKNFIDQRVKLFFTNKKKFQSTPNLSDTTNESKNKLSKDNILIKNEENESTHHYVNINADNSN